MTAVARFIHAHYVLSAFFLGATLRFAAIPLEPYIQGWPTPLWPTLWATLQVIGLCVICQPLRSYRTVIFATLAGLVGNSVVSLPHAALYFPPGSGYPWYVMVAWGVATLLVIWGTIGGILCCAVWTRKRYWPVYEPGCCAKCGYYLRGLPEPRCPECGTPFEPDEVGLLEAADVPNGRWA